MIEVNKEIAKLDTRTLAVYPTDMYNSPSNPTATSAVCNMVAGEVSQYDCIQVFDVSVTPRKRTVTWLLSHNAYHLCGVLVKLY